MIRVALPRVHWLALLVTATALASTVAALAVVRLTTESRTDVVGTTDDGWQVLEHEGVTLEVPDAWGRQDDGQCEFSFERWGPSESDACGNGPGVAFYSDATFDAAYGPRVRRYDDLWGGYRRVGDRAVFALHEDPGVVRRLLSSIREMDTPEG